MGVVGSGMQSGGFGGEEEEWGSVSDWREEGGYGFLNLDSGRRAYIHRSALGGTGSLTVGMKLQVTVVPDTRNPGKICVGKVVSSEDGLDFDVSEPPGKRQRFSGFGA